MGIMAESKISGKTYVFESCTLDGQDATETIRAMYSEQSFSFKDDGVCIQTIVWAGELAESMGSDSVEQTGTYEEGKDTVKVTFEMEGEATTVLEFTIEDDMIKVVEEGSTMVYKLKG